MIYFVCFEMSDSPSKEPVEKGAKRDAKKNANADKKAHGCKGAAESSASQASKLCKQSDKRAFDDPDFLAELLAKGLLEEGAHLDPSLLCADQEADKENGATTTSKPASPVTCVHTEAPNKHPKAFVEDTESFLGPEIHEDSFWAAFNAGRLDLEDVGDLAGVSGQDGTSHKAGEKADKKNGDGM